MQYHLDGFRAGDPELFPAAPGRSLGQSLPDEVDVLIIGSGPAGLTLAAQLAAFPQITTRIVERRAGPMDKGQADGISCRSMEMFNAFGFSEKVLKQGYWVNETTFWKPDANTPAHITRNGRIQDVEDGLSEMPHIILNQARVHDMYLEVMAKSASRLQPDYGLELVNLEVAAAGEYPVLATLKDETGTERQIRAKYTVGCDGARSQVRRSIGRELVGDSANQAWGVMDVLVVTDFPDIRCKTLIQSSAEGNIIIIPREGGHLVRLYIELDKLNAGERVAARNLGIEDLIAAAKRILQPYAFDVREVAWWSVYEIGQRLTDKFDDVAADAVAIQTPRVFIAGDACHTHSPKAGQGMNVSMGDAFNLGWKLISVLTGRASADLLHSYSAERQAVAQDLINFDREWSRIMSERPKTEAETNENTPKFQRYFIEHGRYTAGMSVTYQSSRLTGESTYQHLAQGFPIGARFHSAPVIRLADAKPLELGHLVAADARWRMFAFCGQEDPTTAQAAVRALSDFLYHDPNSPIKRFTPKEAAPDALLDLRVIFQQNSRDIALEQLPKDLFVSKGKLGLRDYEKAFCAVHQPERDIYDLRGIDRSQGCIVIVRPDQYVAHILPLNAHDALSDFFAGIFLPV